MTTTAAAAVLIFADQTDHDEGYARARLLAQHLGSSRARFVPRIARTLDDLLAVARYGIVRSPAVVVVDARGTLLARIPRLPGPDELEQLLAQLTRSRPGG